MKLAGKRKKKSVSSVKKMLITTLRLLLTHVKQKMNLMHVKSKALVVRKRKKDLKKRNSLLVLKARKVS